MGVSWASADIAAGKLNVIARKGEIFLRSTQMDKPANRLTIRQAYEKN
jgi:hypothetical protein